MTKQAILADINNLPQASELYFQAVDQSPVAISITDAETQILYVNRAFTEITGYALEEIQGQKTRILSAGKTPVCIYGELWNNLNQQKAWNGRLVNLRKNKESYLAELTITPVLDDEGQTSHYLAIHRDVTRLQKLHQDLGNQRILTESIVKTSPVATLLIENDGKLRFENPAVEQLCLTLGCATDQLLNLLSQRREIDFQECGDFTELEVRYDIPGISTPRWLRCSGSRLQLWQSDDAFNQEQAHNCLLLTIMDITDLKTQQEEVRINALMARLAENELVYNMREALNGAIYQLQRPLNITEAAAAIQKKRSGESDALHQALDEVLSSCKLAIETLRSSLPDEPALHKMPLNMNDMLREVLSLYIERFLADGVVIDWQPCATLPNVFGDDVSLCNLFKQLLDNSLLAMTEAGTQDRELLIKTECINDFVRVVVADNGPGIDESIQTKVFQPFFSTHKSRVKSGGMGLVLVQDVANKHGATIDITNRHQGCEFSLTFPALA